MFYLTEAHTAAECAFGASEKESAPVARQPQPPRSVAQFTNKDAHMHTHKNKLCSPTLPVVCYLQNPRHYFENPCSHLAGFFLIQAKEPSEIW